MVDVPSRVAELHVHLRLVGDWVDFGEIATDFPRLKRRYLEIFVGLIQAIVFFLLALVFFSIAAGEHDHVCGTWGCHTRQH